VLIAGTTFQSCWVFSIPSIYSKGETQRPRAPIAYLQQNRGRRRPPLLSIRRNGGRRSQSPFLLDVKSGTRQRLKALSVR